MFLKQVYDVDDKSRQCSFVHPGLPRRSSTGGSTILSRTTTTTTTHSHAASFFRDLSAYTASLSSADTASVSGVPVGGKFIFVYVRAISMTACFVSTGDVGGGFASDRESHAAAARIAQQLARHELVSGGTASLDRAARCGKMLRRKVDFKLSFYFHTRNVTERVFNT